MSEKRGSTSPAQTSIPPKNKRPRVKSVRTTKIEDPHVIAIQLVYTIEEGSIHENGVLESLNLITISYNGVSLPLKNTNYTVNVEGLELICNVQPTPNEIVNNFFSDSNLPEGSTVNVNINYVGGGHNADDPFPDIPYSFDLVH